ncbi:MAG: YebC/PmpR family DNA-binding transcriptional regulator [Firmicutes bacterium]|nr:YebC/PmpR family DNA-binding transcriptional regulator [Bacillota bacterium]
MSGHSKWANIKHKKAKTDAQKGRMFSKVTKEIIMAARHGGGNPDANIRLKTAIIKAREVNLPMENISRAIKRGTGELEGVQYEELVYEGYGPGGVAMMVEVTTDNRNRAASDIRYLFSKHGGNLGESGSVSWMFKKVGYITVDRADCRLSEDDLMLAALDAGATDFKAEEDMFEVFTEPDPGAVDSVKEALKRHGVKVAVAEITMAPSSTVTLTGEEAARMLRLVDALEDQDDVQKVHANFDIPQSEMEEYTD